MDAAEVLPVVAMSRPIDDGVGQLELLGELVDDAHVGLVRDEGGEIGSPSTPAASSACCATFTISQTAQRKTVGPSWRSVGHGDFAVAELESSVPFMPDGLRLATRRSPRRSGRCPGCRSAR